MKKDEPIAVEAKKEKVLYEVPLFQYGDKVIIELPEDVEFPNEDSDAQAASFYEGVVGTVVDVYSWCEDTWGPRYAIKLDDNKGCRYSDENYKVIDLKEKYLRDVDEDEVLTPWVTDDFIWDNLRATAFEELFSDDPLKRRMAKYILNLLDK